ncbi:MAG: PstS family phosphate ABC transporter substrate-binding protein [Phycisphaeraceae bacterium]|nr:PstS family phosphate ABC transporter substrate-binding protein [Phycisphaeraceae bacterium]
MRTLLALIACMCVPTAAQPIHEEESPPVDVEIDRDLPEYERAPGVAGNLKSIGSDTLNNVMAFMSETFRTFYPHVDIEVEGKGSSTAPPALIEGQAQFGPMSREMKGSEIDSFEARFGYKPTELRIGIDCLAVYVNKDCPLDSISLDQLERVFSTAGPDMTWGDLGVKDSAYQFRPISLYGRNSASGTYGFFKQFALSNKDYKATVKEQPGSSSVVQAIGRDPFAMGYSGIGYRTGDVKVLWISRPGEEAFEPNYENALTADYPLARFLLVYVNYDERQGLDPLRAEFVRLMFSRQGQEAVVKGGYFPVPGAVAFEDLAKVALIGDEVASPR